MSRRVAAAIWGSVAIHLYVLTAQWILQPLHVSRGIGTTILPLRFGVRPEIAMIELVAEAS